MKISLDSYVPCVFGVLTVFNKEQAIVRSTGIKNEGLSWGRTAVEMGLARMSALGLTKIVAQRDENALDVFSTTESSSIKKNATKPKKTFGF